MALPITRGSDSTPVSIVDINKKVLSDITNAIQSTKDSINRLRDEVDDGNEQRKKQRNSEIVASLAKDRRDRATNAALMGKIDKGTTAIEALQETLIKALDKLTDMIGDMAKQALRSYDETARSLRSIFMSTSDMKVEMLKADKAAQKLREQGIVVTAAQTKQTVAELNKLGFDSRKFSEAQIAAITTGMKSGLSLQEAVAQSQRSKDQLSLAKTFVMASQQTGRETFKSFSSLLEKNQTAMNVYLKRTGKTQEQASQDFLNYSQKIDSVLGGYLKEDKQAELLNQMALLSSGQIEKLDESVFQVLGVSKDAFKNSNNREEIMIQGFQNAIKSGNIEQINILQNAFGGNSDLYHALAQAQGAYKAGNYQEGVILDSFEKAAEAYNANSQGGKLGTLIDGLMTSINTFTADKLGISGGIFGGVAAEINELFGENLSMEDVVTTGFKEVLKILKTAASNGWGGVSTLLTSIFGGGAGAFGASILTGAKSPLANTILKTLTDNGIKGLLLNGLRTALAPLASAILPALPWIGGIAAVVGVGSLAYDYFKSRKEEHKDADDAANKVKQLENKIKELDAKIYTARIEGKDTKALEKEREQYKTQLDPAKKKSIQAGWVAKQNDSDAKTYLTGLEDAKNKIFDLEKQRKEIQRSLDVLKNSGEEGTVHYKVFEAQLKENTAEFGKVINSLNTMQRYSTTKQVDSLKDFTTLMQGEKVSSILSPEVAKDWVDSATSTSGDVGNILDILNNMQGALENVENEQRRRDEEEIRRAEQKISTRSLLANGGIFNTATPSIVGEAGKEIILPLTRPERMRELLGSLTNSEKGSILSAITNSGSSQSTQANQAQSVQSNSSVPGDDQASINKILSYAANKQYVYDSLLYGRNRDGSLKSKKPNGFEKRREWYNEALSNASNQEGRDLIKGTYAERALEWGVSQLGKPYLLREIGKIGYVCNELTNAALLGSGFNMGDFRFHSVKTTFNNIQKGKYVSGKDSKGRDREYPAFRLRPDITPETAIPGMIFFQDGRRNKEGGFMPGHVGLVYYGHQKLHSSGGSGDYSSAAAFLNKYQTPCRGVTVTPFDNGSYMFGEFPGLFEQASGEWNPPENSPVPFGPYDITKAPGADILAEQNNLSKSALDATVESASRFYGAEMRKYVQSTVDLVKNGDTKNILSFMEIMTKYLRDIASSPANKPRAISPARPVPNRY